MAFFVARAGFFAAADVLVRRFAVVDVSAFAAVVLRLRVVAVIDLLLVERAVDFGAATSAGACSPVSVVTAGSGAGIAGVSSMFKTSRTWLMSE